MDAMRFKWLRDNQKNLKKRCTNIRNLSQNVDLSNLGQRVILGASFPGSPRYFDQRYYQALALLREYGKPSLLITTTCNPDWPEIKAFCCLENCEKD